MNVLKLVLSYVLLLSFTVHSASASNIEGFITAYDELEYALTVEWDQNDPEFHEEQLRKFNSKVEALKASGLTYRDAKTVLLSKVKNAKLQNDISEAFNFIDMNSLSEQDAANYLQKALQGKYVHGAAWWDEVGQFVVLGVIFPVVATIAGIYYHNKVSNK